MIVEGMILKVYISFEDKWVRGTDSPSTRGVLPRVIE